MVGPKDPGAWMPYGGTPKSKPPAPSSASRGDENEGRAPEAPPPEVRGRFTDLAFPPAPHDFHDKVTVTAEWKAEKEGARRSVTARLHAVLSDGTVSPIEEKYATVGSSRLVSIDFVFYKSRTYTYAGPSPSTPYFFTLESDGIPTAKSPSVTVREGEEFQGSILFSPSRNEYLVLTGTEEEEIAKEAFYLHRLQERLSESRALTDPQKRLFAQKALVEQLRKDEKSSPSEEGSEGDTGAGPDLKAPSGAKAKVAVEELLLVQKGAGFLAEEKKHQKSGNAKERTQGFGRSFVYIRPYKTRVGNAVKGHWRKNTDKTVEKKLKALLRLKKPEKKPLLEGKVKASLLNMERAQQLHWPWEWKWVYSRFEKPAPGETAIDYSSQAAFGRFFATAGLVGEFDPKKKVLRLEGQGEASYSLFEGQVTGHLHLPSNKGLNLLSLCRSVKGIDAILKKKHECMLRLSMKLTGEVFSGLSLSAAVALPLLDLNGLSQGKGKAEASGGGQAFAGARASGTSGFDLSWSYASNMAFESMGDIGYTAGASVGAGAKSKLLVRYSEGRFHFEILAGFTYGWGVEGGIRWSVDFIKGAALLGHLLRAVDYHFVAEIAAEAFAAFRNYAFACAVKAKEIVGEGVEAALEEVRDFRVWLRENLKDIDKIKSELRQSRFNGFGVYRSPPEALGQALIVLMQTREEEDFEEMKEVLRQNPNGHKLKWILRTVSEVPLPERTHFKYEAKKKEALRKGIERIRAFGSGDPARDQEPNEEFLKYFDNLLEWRGISEKDL